MQTLFYAIVLSASLLPFAQGLTCEIVQPLGNVGVPEVGLIMVPGAGIPGENYMDLALEIQAQFAGNLWVGLTEDWLLDAPNPAQIAAAINDCYEAASLQYLLPIDTVYISGHSLGGIMLETYIQDHPDKAKGIILFGSYLADGFGGVGDNNEFVVPTLTAIGSLDGQTLAYARREYEESALAEQNFPGQFPVIIVEDCNHAQVGSGASMSANDINPVLPEDEAHRRYARTAVTFLTLQTPGFETSVYATQQQILEQLETYTDAFLEPFFLMAAMDGDDKQTPWAIAAQRKLAQLTEEDDLENDANNRLYVSNNLTTSGDLGGSHPFIYAEPNCGLVTVQTYSHNNYDPDPLDADGLGSAAYMKAKMMLMDYVRDALCLTRVPSYRPTCMDLNNEAIELALSVASEDAVSRYLDTGNILTPIEDNEAGTGPGWLYSGGLKYNDTIVEGRKVTTVQSTNLITEDTLIYPGVNYCDLLTPYRALEWIYLRGVANGNI